MKVRIIEDIDKSYNEKIYIKGTEIEVKDITEFVNTYAHYFNIDQQVIVDFIPKDKVEII